MRGRTAKVRLLAAGARVRDVVPDILGREALSSAEARRSYFRQEHHEDKRGQSVAAYARLTQSSTTLCSCRFCCGPRRYRYWRPLA
jgi:hypothetical protein